MNGAVGLLPSPFALVPFSQLEPGDDGQTFLLEGHFTLPRGEVTLLYGDSGIGKSWFMAQVLVAVASGTTFLGGRATQAPVLLIDFENRPDETWRRIAKVAEAQGMNRRGLDGWVYPVSLAPTGMGLSDCIEEAMRAIDRVKPGLIVVDGWQAAFGGNMVDGEVVTDAARLLHRLQGEDRAVLVLHHVSTAGTKSAPAGTAPDPAGNRGVRHVARAVYHLGELRKGSSTYTLTVVKENYGLSTDPVALIRQQDKAAGIVTFELAGSSFSADVSRVTAPKPTDAAFDWNGEALSFLRTAGGEARAPDLYKHVAGMRGQTERNARRVMAGPLAALQRAGMIRAQQERNSLRLYLVPEADKEPDTAEAEAA